MPSYTFNIDNTNIVTYGEVRLKHFKKRLFSAEANANRVQITIIGLYINYADSIIYQAEKKKIEEDHGKILLVFPSHSIEGVIYRM